MNSNESAVLPLKIKKTKKLSSTDLMRQLSSGLQDLGERGKMGGCETSDKVA